MVRAAGNKAGDSSSITTASDGTCMVTRRPVGPALGIPLATLLRLGRSEGKSMLECLGPLSYSTH